MTKKKITLVLFCFNEMEGLKHTLSKLNNKHKIFVIDGTSVFSSIFALIIILKLSIICSIFLKTIKE